MDLIKHYINGEDIEGGSRQGDVYNPAIGEVVSKVTLGDLEVVNNAIESSKKVLEKWRYTTPAKRASIMFNYKKLLEDNSARIAEMVSKEHGKTIEDAKGSLQRGIEVVEYACGIPNLLKGEYSNQVGSGIDTFSMKQELGICAGITPFNFPVMIPLWMFPLATACGNAFILKPSERDPSVPMMLANLMLEAGLPEGILQVVNGDKEIVDAILDNEDISAIGFVGSTPIAEYIYSRGCSNGKRVQCFGGAKNHMIIMPDADLDQAADALVGAGYGAAGERCMAISVALPVGKETGDKLIEKLVPKIEALKIGPYTSENEVDFGPVVTKQAQQRILSLVNSGIESGANLVVDGRNFQMQGYENGFFVGACLFDNVKTDMEIYKQEIFGPVLSTVRTESYEEALSIAFNNEYGNGTAIFTRDGDTARDFANRINIGMVGINVPIPVPLAYHTFGGWKKSAFGDLNQHGPDAFRFYTRTKTITSRWPTGIKEGAKFSIPTMD